jgi:hypothetical protein
MGYSGGVDSVFLARVAVDVLGPHRVLAVTGKSDSIASWMEDTAREVAGASASRGWRWRRARWTTRATPPTPATAATSARASCGGGWRRGARARLRAVLDGSNADDVGDHRPGAVAADENAVRSPLLEAGLTKDEIRAWSRELGLPTWDQPAAPCLASRLPYGSPSRPSGCARWSGGGGAARARLPRLPRAPPRRRRAAGGAPRGDRARGRAARAHRVRGARGRLPARAAGPAGLPPRRAERGAGGRAAGAAGGAA